MAATKALRWKLLEMFPDAPMNLIAEVAKCGELSTASDLLGSANVAASIKEELAESAGMFGKDASTLERRVASWRAATGVPEPLGSLVPLPIVDAAHPDPACPCCLAPKDIDLDDHCYEAERTISESVASDVEAIGEDVMPPSPRARGSPSTPCSDGREPKSAIVAECDVAALSATIPLDHISSSSKTTKSKIVTTKDGWEIKCVIDVLRPCQSLRSLYWGRQLAADPASLVLQHVGQDNTAAFAAVCFEQMIQREQDLEGDFCVFYHSYNGAALLYETQAVIARCAFGLADDFAPLPRLLIHRFKDSSLRALKEAFGTMTGQDHDPRFRELAISASPALFAFGSEAPPLHCFRTGYGCSDVSFRKLLVELLRDTCGTNEVAAIACADELCDVALRFGLRDDIYRDYTRPAKSTLTRPPRLGGQMLQIFIAREEVDKLVYHSHPFGTPIESTKSVKEWLANPGTPNNPAGVDGQVRILCDPRVFMDPRRGRIYHYSGDWEFFGGSLDMPDSRAAFVAALRHAMAPLLSSRTRIYNNCVGNAKMDTRKCNKPHRRRH